MKNYAKIIIKGSPISKSNFKLFNLKGRAILPFGSGKYHDRYAIYEETIAYETRLQNPSKVLTESLIAILKVFYKSQKRHPDTNNITKSIFDGIEKSGLIVDDAQIRRLVIEEYYDKENPRFELELYGESSYTLGYEVIEREEKADTLEYSFAINNKLRPNVKTKNISKEASECLCDICRKPIDKDDCISANKGQTLICHACFKKLF